MPYPLSTVPYGFLRRLNDLSSPFEAFQLQKINLELPHRRLEHVSKHLVTIHVDTKTCYDTFTPARVLKFDKEIIYRVEAGLKILDCGEKNNIEPLLNYFHLNPNELVFRRCHITQRFLKTIVSRLNQPVLWFSLKRCVLTPGITVAFILETFPSVTRFWLEKPLIQHDWVKIFLKLKKTGMYLLDLSRVTMNVLNIDKADFLKFFKAQNIFFELMITIVQVESLTEMEEKKRYLLGESFNIYTKNDSMRRNLSIRCSKCIVMPKHKGCKQRYGLIADNFNGTMII